MKAQDLKDDYAISRLCMFVGTVALLSPAVIMPSALAAKDRVALLFSAVMFASGFLIFLSAIYWNKAKETKQLDDFRLTISELFTLQRGHLQEAVGDRLRESARNFHEACEKQAKHMQHYSKQLQGMANADPEEREKAIHSLEATKTVLDWEVARAKKEFWSLHRQLKGATDLLEIPFPIVIEDSSRFYLDSE